MYYIIVWAEASSVDVRENLFWKKERKREGKKSAIMTGGMEKCTWSSHQVLHHLSSISFTHSPLFLLFLMYVKRSLVEPSPPPHLARNTIILIYEWSDIYFDRGFRC